MAWAITAACDRRLARESKRRFAGTAHELKRHLPLIIGTLKALGDLYTTEARYDDRWTLVYFGYTYCPDICPTTMAFLNEFVAQLEAGEVADTQVVLVSVDPARDTVGQMATYVPYFNPDFIGVTGEFLDIHRFATALNTPFRRVPGQDDDSYVVDHSANVVLINPRGDYHGFFKAPLDLEKMTVTYRSARAAWDKAH